MMWPIPHFWIIDIGESVLEKRAHKTSGILAWISIAMRERRSWLRLREL